MREAVRLRPGDADYLNELGMAVWGQKRPAEAETIYREAYQINPDNYKTLANLGLAIHEQRRPGEAAQFYRMALAIRPDGFEAIMNLGIVLSDEGRFEEAMGLLISAHQLRPDSSDALQNLGMNLARLGRWDDAIVIYEEALRRSPESPSVHRNLAYALLICGDYERGWPEHEWRFKCPDYIGSRVNRTFWNGDDFHRQAILLHAEQGYGDTLQFIRFAPMVKRRGGRVVVLCQTPLLRWSLAATGSIWLSTAQLRPRLSCPCTVAEPAGDLRHDAGHGAGASALSGHRSRCSSNIGGPSWPGRSKSRPGAAGPATDGPDLAAEREAVSDRDRLARKPDASHGSLAIISAGPVCPTGRAAGRPADQLADRPWPGSARGPGRPVSGHRADRPPRTRLHGDRGHHDAISTW